MAERARREEQLSPETLTAQLLADQRTMKVLKKLKARIGLSNKQGLICPPGQPLEFHPVHGDNVQLTQGNTIAERYVVFL